jgi:hypothetical protein
LAIDDIRSFDDLNALYWKNRELLGGEEQRLFQAILLEMQKGDGCDYALLETYLRRLGELRGLT